MNSWATVSLQICSSKLCIVYISRICSIQTLSFWWNVCKLWLLWFSVLFPEFPSFTIVVLIFCSLVIFPRQHRAGNNSQSSDIVQPNFEYVRPIHILIGHDVRTFHRHNWLLPQNVLYMSRLLPNRCLRRLIYDCRRLKFYSRTRAVEISFQSYLSDDLNPLMKSVTKIIRTIN